MAPDITRVAVVTGGTRGLGAAVTSRLAAAGVTVAAAFRSDKRAAAAFERDLDAPAGVSTHQVDVSDPAQCLRFVAEVLDRHGRIDHLVNNAGSMTERKLADLDVVAFESSLRTNLTSQFTMAHAVLPSMKAARFGRIVNVGSITAVMGSPFQVDYAAAKSGLVGLTRSLARAVARSGVTVNCVLPGGFRTDLLDDMTLTDGAVIESNVPIGRFGEPAEFAHVVASLLHDDAGYVTGSTVVVDGGLGMGQ
jgi:acetoacetyl-CoA reductase/3-oxoacyl-[acyl-carrier protein] reductase